MDELENMSKEEKIGFHKGSLSTLSKEREELSRILSIVEQLMRMHINNLKELGVDLENVDTSKAKTTSKSSSGKKKPIEDLL